MNKFCKKQSKCRKLTCGKLDRSQVYLENHIELEPYGNFKSQPIKDNGVGVE